MNIKGCVDEVIKNCPEVSESEVKKTYVKTYISIILISATIMVWAVSVLPAVSTALLDIVVIAVLLLYVLTSLLLFGKGATTESSYKGLRLFSKFLPLWVLLLVASFVATYFLKAQFLL